MRRACALVLVLIACLLTPELHSPQPAGAAVSADLPAAQVTGIAISTGAATGPAGTFSTTYGAIGVDYQSRKVTARLDKRTQIEKIELLSSRPTTRVTSANWSIYVSSDDVTYTKVTGWTWQQTSTSTGLKHTFSGFKATAKFVKVTTSYTDSAFTFVLNEPMTDFQVHPAIGVRAAAVVADFVPASGRAPRLVEKPGAIALDARANSLVIDFFGRSVDLDAVQIMSSGTSSRLTQSQYQLYWSNDNLRYFPINGWTFNSAVEGGRLGHTFGNLNTTAKYLKIHQTFETGTTTFRLPDPANDVRVDGDLLPAADEGQLDVVSSRWVTTDTTFPEGTDPSKRSAQGPSVVKLANGDILLAFNTAMDGNPGDIRMMRSTDGGVTWGPSTLWRSPSYYPDGAVGSARGFTTLPDGTVLFHFSETVNHNRFNNREAVQFVARSTDNGVTWTGKDTPITLPTPIREAFDPGAPILRTESGTLLFPIWGVKELGTEWETRPNAAQSGVLRSFDNGVTWSDYKVVGHDRYSPPNIAPFTTTPSGTGSSEMSMQQLPSGRIVAFLRHYGLTDAKPFQGWRSYSDDDGATWSKPTPVDHLFAAGWAVPAPCSAHLSGGKTKLLYGGRGLEYLQNTVLTTSYDEGVSWHGQVPLEGPPDWNGNNGPLTGEPEFLPLNDRDLLVIYQVTKEQSGLVDPNAPSEPFRLYANVVRDAAPADCEAQADATIAAQSSMLRFTVERADRDGWAWPWASKPASYSPQSAVATVIGAEAEQIGCLGGSSLALRKRGTTTPLPNNVTLAAAGVHTGDALELYNPSPPTTAPFVFGWTDRDSHPTNRPIANFSTACEPGRRIFDTQSRSLGLDVTIPSGKAVQSITMTGRYSVSRLTSSNITILTSSDNETFTPVTGWTMTSSVVGGHYRRSFTGLDLTQRYVKIAENTTDTTFSDVLDKPSSDIALGIS